MTQHIEEAWRYEIQYGPEGEADYAWLYRGDEMVATMKTHHAVAIAAALAAAEERGRRDGQNSTGMGQILAEQMKVNVLRPANAITKEPTP